MLADPTTEDDHPGLFRSDAHIVQSSNVAHDVDNKTGVFIGMEVDHVS